MVLCTTINIMALWESLIHSVAWLILRHVLRRSFRAVYQVSGLSSPSNLPYLGTLPQGPSEGVVCGKLVQYPRVTKARTNNIGRNLKGIRSSTDQPPIVRLKSSV